PVPLRITSVSQPDSGSVEISNDQQHLIFHAGTNFTGTLTFEYTAQRTEQNVDTGSIGNAETEITATVNILVAPPLYAGDDFAGTADGSAVVANVLDNDMENVRHFDHGPLKAYGNHDYRRQLKITGIGIAANGTVEIGQDARSIRYTPHDDFVAGVDSVSYTVTDHVGNTDTATLTIAVGNDAMVDQEDAMVSQMLMDSVAANNPLFGVYTAEDNSGVYWSYGQQTRLRTTSLDSTLVTPGVEDTNNQVDGVDEGNLAKSDGQSLFILSNQDTELGSPLHQLTITDIATNDSPVVHARFGFEEPVIAQYLSGDQVIVLSGNYQFTRITTLDVSDPAQPQLVSQSSVEGRLETSRMIDGELLTVFQTDLWSNQIGPQPISSTPEDPTTATASRRHSPNLTLHQSSAFRETRRQFADRVTDTILADTVPTVETVDAAGDLQQMQPLLTTTELIGLLRPEDAGDAHGLFPGGLSIASASTATIFDVNDAQPGVTDTVLLHDTWNATYYVSPDALYVATIDYRWQDGQGPHTDVAQFLLPRDGSIARAAEGTVPGTLLNQFSMDAHDGQLRLATTVREFSTPESTNAMFVLQPDGDRLEIVGQQTGLAHGEQIYSVRFAGDRAYVVTFRTIDPFFVFDLSDPTDPVALGGARITLEQTVLRDLTTLFTTKVTLVALTESGAPTRLSRE
ncbi:MAG: beta-propeller domain-containing protein, partial [Planctomycetota bacterium]